MALALPHVKTAARSSIRSDEKFRRAGTATRLSSSAGFGSLLAKVAGLARELSIASILGSTTAAEAHAHALALPSFFNSAVATCGGPLHAIAASTLGKERTSRSQLILCTFCASACTLFASVLLALLAQHVVSFTSPSLAGTTRASAVVQLRIMALAICCSGATGVLAGFSTASGKLLLPSALPVASSAATVAACSAWYLGGKPHLFAFVDPVAGGIVPLAIAVVTGSVLQLLIVLSTSVSVLLPSSPSVNHSISTYPSRSTTRASFPWPQATATSDVRLTFADRLKDVKAKLGNAPIAIGASACMHMAAFVDLRFASASTGSAAILGYASLLANGGLGIVSSAALNPLPSRIGEASELYGRSVAASVCSLRAISSSLSVALLAPSLALVASEPFVALAFERGAFVKEDTHAVASAIAPLAAGSCFGIARDACVQSWSAAGSAAAPFVGSVLHAVLKVSLTPVVVAACNGRPTATTLALGSLVAVALSAGILTCASALGLGRERTSLKWRVRLLSLHSNLWLHSLGASAIVACATRLVYKSASAVVPPLLSASAACALGAVIHFYVSKQPYKQYNAPHGAAKHGAASLMRVGSAQAMHAVQKLSHRLKQYVER